MSKILILLGTLLLISCTGNPQVQVNLENLPMVLETYGISEESKLLPETWSNEQKEGIRLFCVGSLLVTTQYDKEGEEFCKFILPKLNQE